MNMPNLKLKDVLAMSKAELEEDLRARGKPCEGTKVDLQIQLIEAIESLEFHDAKNGEEGEDKKPIAAEGDYKRVSKLIPSFNGKSDFAVWRNAVDEIRKTHNCDKEKMKLEIVFKLTGTVKEWFESSNKYHLSYDALLDEIKRNFWVEKSPFDLRNDLQARVWRDGETMAEYIQAKVILSARLDLPDKELIQYIVAGAGDEATQNQLRMGHFQSVDVILQQIGTMRKPPQSTTVHRPHDRQWRAAADYRQQPTQPQQWQERRCYRCNLKGHMANQCTSEIGAGQGVCYICGVAGHMARDCSAGNQINQIGVGGKYINFVVNFNDRTMTWRGLIDTGSPISLIRECSCGEYIPNNNFNNFRGLNRTKLNVLGLITRVVGFDGKRRDIDFYIVPDYTIDYNVLLGRDFLNQFRGRLLFDHEELNFFSKIEDSENEISLIPEIEKIADRAELTIIYGVENNNNFVDEELNALYQINVVEDEDPKLIINESISYEDQSKVKKIFNDVYLNGPIDNIDQKTKMKLIVKKDCPIYFKPRRLSVAEKDNLQKCIDDLLRQNIIRPSTSEYSSPIVMVKKKNGEMRLCVDYTELNNATTREIFPIPHIEDQIAMLQGKTFFSSLDLKNGFYNIKMDPDSVKYTAFTTPLGNFEFLRMPFGLKNAPSVFQRVLHNLFADLIRAEKLLIYLDDLLIPSDAIEEHLEILAEVLRRLKGANLELRLDKCKFLQVKIEYLGYVIEKNKIRPSDSIGKNFRFPSQLDKFNHF